MARPRDHLTNAPLREALIDLQFDPLASIDDIDRFVLTLGETVEKKGDIWEAYFGMVEPAQGRPFAAQSIHNVLGRRLDLKQGSAAYVLQCRINGFSLSRLSPYGSWAELRADAQSLWNRFITFAPTRTINRMAVRYINELRLPLPFQDFKEFLESPPIIPTGLPQLLSGFLTRTTIPDMEQNWVTIVTQALEVAPAHDSQGTSTVNVILDIDVFRQNCVELAASETIWSALDALREQKNRVFFAYVTEKTVEMYA